MTGYQGPMKAAHAIARTIAGNGIAAWDIGWSHVFYSGGVRSQAGWTILSATDGQPVSTWVNDVVAADSLAQATVALQPVWRRTGGIAGNVAVEGRNVTDGILALDFTTTINQPWSVVHIGRFAAEPSADATLSDNHTTGGTARIYVEVDDDTVKMTAGTLLTGPVMTPITGGHLVVCHGDGNGSFVELDNASRITGAAGANPLVGLSVFGMKTGAAPCAWRSEFIGVYPGDVTTDDKWRLFLRWVEEEFLLDMSL